MYKCKDSQLSTNKATSSGVGEGGGQEGGRPSTFQEGRGVQPPTLNTLSVLILVAKNIA